MKNTLENIAVKTCENLPLDITIFEREIFCSIRTDKCEYSRKYDLEDNYLCNKKTYTGNLQTIN